MVEKNRQNVPSGQLHESRAGYTLVHAKLQKRQVANREQCHRREQLFRAQLVLDSRPSAPDLAATGTVQLDRLGHEDTSAAHQALDDADQVTRLVCFGTPFTETSLRAMSGLRELAAPVENSLRSQLTEAGIRLIEHQSEGFWGQSVAEFALGLTICGLRRIPQTHHNILTDLSDWEYGHPEGVGRSGQRGHQFGDDGRFSNGTIQGKRVRIVGAGNIGSRYADFCHHLGADVAIWDPFASEPSFHRAGARREHFLERLVQDAEIFAPMVPLTPETEGLVPAAQIRALPEGCLVVMATRARICDCDTLYERVSE